MTSTVTIFKNIKETETPFYRDVQVVFNRIKDGATKELVKRIRLEKNKTERNELKKMLPAICFSGTFNKRNDNSLIQHSGLICLDFDGYEKTKEMLQDKENLSKDKYVYSTFISPSGNGLKVLVKVPSDSENHINYFNSLEKHFNSQYFDKVVKNISRVCYESYDPLIHVNEHSSVWDKIEESQYTEVNKFRDTPTIPITDENKIVDILVKWWNDWGLDAPTRDFLPDDATSGLIVFDGDDPVCAGFIYTMNAKVTWVEWIISSRTYRKKPERKECLDLLIYTLTHV